MDEQKQSLPIQWGLRRRIKFLLIIFISGLVLSGITAFPLEWELRLANDMMAREDTHPALAEWIQRVYVGVKETNARYPFVSYGTDWLAFAHFVIAVAFVGPLKEPVRNIWVVEFGIIACIAVFPLALIAGEVRHIPLFWRLLDCVFGFAGGLILIVCYRDIAKLETLTITS